VLTNLIHRIFSLITIELIILAAGLFLVGLFLSIYVVKKEIKWLCRFPEWIWNKLKSYLEQQPGFNKLFLLIFLLNSTSLFFNLISGFGVVLPIFFAILTGMNVGIIAYKEGGTKAFLSMFVAPNAIFELPAAWLSIALGIRLGLEMIASESKVGMIFSECLLVYFKVILPLLLIAALLESALVYISIRKLQHPTSLPKEPLES
jgi:uncharacterized membrane protein SpoIIM required for sporulation